VGSKVVLHILAIDLSTETLSRSRWAANAPSPKSWTDRRAPDRKRRGRPHARPRLRPARRGLGRRRARRFLLHPGIRRMASRRRLTCALTPRTSWRANPYFPAWAAVAIVVPVLVAATPGRRGTPSWHPRHHRRPDRRHRRGGRCSARDRRPRPVGLEAAL